MKGEEINVPDLAASFHDRIAGILEMCIRDRWDRERSLAERSALCEANHMEAVAQVTQKRQTPETGIVLGLSLIHISSFMREFSFFLQKRLAFSLMHKCRPVKRFFTAALAGTQNWCYPMHTL